MPPCAIARNLRRLRSRGELRVVGGDGARLTKDLQPTVGTRRIVERPCRELYTRIGARQNCVSVPQPPPPYGLGPGEERDARSLQDKAEWRRARRGSRIRFRLRWHGRGSTAADVSARPAEGPIKDVILEIKFLDPGVEVFSFTFG